MHVLKHFLTITKHRHSVMRNCFKAGLYRQGLLHDLSKYGFTEFWAGARYYQGNRSPQAREREVLGYSAAWLHHKGRNKHHFEYWTDFADGKRVYVKMPPKYLAEMVCDRIAACKIYLKDNYTRSSPLEYFNAKTDKTGMHPETLEKLEYFLTVLNDSGEKEMFKQLKSYVKENKNKPH